MIFPQGDDRDDDYDEDKYNDDEEYDELLLFWCGQGLPLMLMWSGGLQNMERWPRRHAARYQISYFTTRDIQRVVQNIYPQHPPSSFKSKTAEGKK